ncbi:MAG: transposase [Gemmatimonadota bacterium]
MPHTPFPHRQSIRLDGWDYAGPGWYFITTGTWQRRRVLARVDRRRMRLTRSGRIVQRVWEALPAHFPNLTIDGFVIMPDHIHGILCITRPCRAERARAGGQQAVDATSGSLGAVVRSLKGNSTRLIRRRWPEVGRVWHRNYYERVIEHAEGLERARRYVAQNPEKWIRSRG